MSDASAPDDFEAELARLSADYARDLPARVAELREAHARGAAGAADLCEGAHRLRGTAGSYGFAEISALAGRLEDALRPPLDARTEVAATLAAQAGTLADLEATARRIAASTTR